MRGLQLFLAPAPLPLQLMEDGQYLRVAWEEVAALAAGPGAGAAQPMRGYLPPVRERQGYAALQEKGRGLHPESNVQFDKLLPYDLLARVTFKNTV